MDAWPNLLEEHRHELTGYCRGVLGSESEAQDAVQETLLRAWRAADRFERRSSVRTWLYRIATNVCFDMIRARQRRPWLLDLGPSGWDELEPAGELSPGPGWEHGDPAEIAASRESVRLALVAVLRHLPARQRAVLILCEVLCWHASEAATLLDTSVAAVNSALQRARAALASPSFPARTSIGDDPVRRLAAGYARAFERHDMHALVTLLHDDVARVMSA